ncbi:small conductance calcium-activated potassium channel protein [Fasciolopsis buskii]|uniref:Small conductance calcium-activated potassium channel protein n=1 Tax=Fasciolopsis buskii TaxID=27845 RepID=A0A8E0S8C5_9TREM|nr:small conductance calcium-activated potassium channel protein [Fasciolopsis buski]
MHSTRIISSSAKDNIVFLFGIPQIFLCEEYIKDWRISVTRRRVLQVVTELVICSIHPVPGVDLFFHKPHPIRLPTGPPRYYSQLDDSFSPYLLLVLPMIGRFYLAFRTLLLHSKMFNDAGSRSIGSMNKICFDLRFVLKTLMTLCPVKTLLVFIVTLWLVLSWTLRACEL